MKLVMTSGGCLPEASIGQYRRAHGAPTVPVTVHVFDRTSRKCKVWRAPVSEKLGGEPVMRLIYGTTGTVFDEDGRCLSSAQVWITAR